MPLSSDTARQGFRLQARQVAAAPHDVAAHLARLAQAMQMDGVEPAQGALADLFTSLDADGAATKAAALALASPKLSAHVRDRYRSWVGQPRLPRVTPLATRWSVLAQPSAGVTTRARRVSVDDSQAMAALVLQAVAQGDLAAQENFLHHCLTCRDRLAFMLARRELLRRNGDLPPGWAEVAHTLEEQTA